MLTLPGDCGRARPTTAPRKGPLMNSPYLDRHCRSHQEALAAAAPPPRARKRGRTVKRDGPHPIDIHVGQRVRLRRILLGLSQEKLAERIGFTFQQLQKYERGANRISCSVLHSLSQALEVPVSFFFDDLAGVDLPAGLESDQLTKRETLELVRNFYSIDQPARDSIYAMVAGLSKALSAS